MDIEEMVDRYPSVDYLAEAARRRIPHFAWEYLDSGTGRETAIARNREALDQVRMVPRFIQERGEPDLTTGLFGRHYSAPFGMAPIGLTGMMWPGGELMLARAARKHNIPFGLSTVACETPESVGAVSEGNAWFQLYPFADRQTEAQVLARAQAAGFSVLVVTVDVPVSSTRERQRRAGMRSGSKSWLSRLLQVAARPRWALATARHGAPRFRMLEDYVDDPSLARISEYIGRQLGTVDIAHLQEIRDRWKGPLIVKGILDEKDARTCLQMGMDGIVVSNHGARQFDAAPAAIDALARIAPSVAGRMAVLFDSGIRGGLDIMRALALGADFVLVGRAFMFGICALGEPGAGLVAHILKTDMVNNMNQLGCLRPGQLAARLERSTVAD